MIHKQNKNVERFILDDPLKTEKTREISGYIDMNGCWICDSHIPLISSKSKKEGYFKICRSVDGKEKQILIHRYAYENKYNVKLTSDIVVRHKCDNPFCVKPEHLELGSHKDNVKDRVERNRSAKGKNNGRSKLTEEDVKFIKSSNETQTALAKKFGVDRKSIYNVLNDINWKEVK